MRISEGKPWKETLLEVLPQRKFQPRGLRRNKTKQTEDEEMDDDAASDDGNTIEGVESADPEPQAENKNNEIPEE